MAVSEPLGAWRLEYYASSSVAGAAAGGLPWWRGPAPAALLALGVLALAFYFYREQAREMRDAAQRVSFVNQVSHELKTPLTNIRMYAELLDKDLGEQSNAGEDNRSRRYLDVIVFESQRLSRLIGNVLSFSRSRREALELHRQSGVVDDVIQRVLDQFEPALRTKDIDVRFAHGRSPTSRLRRRCARADSRQPVEQRREVRRRRAARSCPPRRRTAASRSRCRTPAQGSPQPKHAASSSPSTASTTNSPKA